MVALTFVIESTITRQVPERAAPPPLPGWPGAVAPGAIKQPWSGLRGAELRPLEGCGGSLRRAGSSRVAPPRGRERSPSAAVRVVMASYHWRSFPRTIEAQAPGSFPSTCRPGACCGYVLGGGRLWRRLGRAGRPLGVLPVTQGVVGDRVERLAGVAPRGRRCPRGCALSRG